MVLPALHPAAGVETGVADILTELLLEALHNRHGIRALGPGDIKEMLSLEQQRQLMGCEEDSCMADLAGALGARHLIAGTVGRLGSIHVLTLKLIDSETASVVSRASRKLQSIEASVDAIGPLSDELLNARPVIRPKVPVAPTTAVAQPAEILETRAFCKRVEKWQDAVTREAYAPSLVSERQILLTDLLFTPFKQQFDAKRSCVWEYSGRLDNGLKRQVLRASTEQDAVDARRRMYEWYTLARQLKILEEAYTTGLEKERLGTGRRPGALPFRVAEATPPEPEDTKEVAAYVKAWTEVTEVLGKALTAAGRRDIGTFKKQWAPEDPERSRTSLEHVWDALLRNLENGYRLEPCPLYIMSADELEDGARTLDRQGRFEACYRKVSDDWVSTEDVWFVKDGERWRIERW